MSTIEFNMILSEVDNLARELNRHKDEELSHQDKITVSDLLAETVQMIRKKYKITSVYYMVSESKALEGIGPTGISNEREGEWNDDYTEHGWIRCSGCGNQEWWEHKTRYCPNCGRRMKNGK